MNSWNGYPFGEKLPDGAFGKVYKTQKNGKTYCIKIMSKTEIKRNKAQKYVIGEINVLKKIKDSGLNLLNLIEHGEDDNNYYLVTEFYNGGDVGKLLEKKMDGNPSVPFTEMEVQYILKQILPSLNHLHKNNILHRDLKLDNLMIDYKNEADFKAKNILNARIIIVDFGFARFLKDGELAQSDLGSAPYKDPNLLLKEVHKNKKTRDAMNYKYDQKLDIWSLGILCYEMLVGDWAFSADNMDELLEKVSKGYYFLPNDIHQETFDFITSMLHFDPEKRPSTEQLLNFPFITKNFNQFTPLDTSKLRKAGGEIVVNATK